MQIQSKQEFIIDLPLYLRYLRIRKRPLAMVLLTLETVMPNLPAISGMVIFSM